MQNALKLIPSDDTKSEEMKSGGELTRFVNRKWFKSLIMHDIALVRFHPIVCYKGNQKINGYEATTLVDFCNLILDARNNDLIKTDRQVRIATRIVLRMRNRIFQ